MSKQYSMTALIAKFEELSLKTTKTITHAACPTCEVHTEQLAGTELNPSGGSGFIQAKNLFFKVPSKGGPLKDKLFLVCAAVDTDLNNKQLSKRLGIKESAPLRLADEKLFDEVLCIPRGSVNPFVMLNETTINKQVTLLLDQKFVGNKVLFHPMDNTATTVISQEELDKLFASGDGSIASHVLYVDFASDAEISLDAAAAGAAAAAPAAKKKEEPVAKKEEKKDEKPKEKKVQTHFADDWLFKRIEADKCPIFAAAFKRYNFEPASRTGLNDLSTQTKIVPAVAA